MENLLSSRIYLPFRKITLVFRWKVCYKQVETGKKELLSLSTISVLGEMQGEVACNEGRTNRPARPLRVSLDPPLSTAGPSAGAVGSTSKYK